MKKHENLGKSLNRNEQKSISGGATRQIFNLYCDPGNGNEVFIDDYFSLSACNAAGAAECSTLQWLSCRCSGTGGGSFVCL